MLSINQITHLISSLVGLPWGGGAGAPGAVLVELATVAFPAGVGPTPGGLFVVFRSPRMPLVMVLTTCPTCWPTCCGEPMSRELNGEVAAGAPVLTLLLSGPLATLPVAPALEASKSLVSLGAG
jgi:hypothetical protein